MIAAPVVGEIGRERRGFADWRQDHPAEREVEAQIEPTHGTSIGRLRTGRVLVVLNTDAAGRAFPLHPGRCIGASADGVAKTVPILCSCVQRAKSTGGDREESQRRLATSRLGATARTRSLHKRLIVVATVALVFAALARGPFVGAGLARAALWLSPIFIEMVLMHCDRQRA